MKKNILERIIRNALLEYSIPVKADVLLGSDQADYEAAGAIAGFDVRVIAKKFKGERPSESQLFKSINNVIQQDVDFEKIGFRNIANRGGMVALISGDLRAAARNYSFRVWFFEEQYWKYQTMMLPLNEKGQKLSTPTEIGFVGTPEQPERVIDYGYTMYLGKAGVRFFKNGEQYANLNWISAELKTKDTLDLKGLREYEAWYNKLKKINVTLPTAEFKMPDIDKLPAYEESDDKIYVVDEEPTYFADANGESVPISGKLENEEIQIQQYIGSTKDNTTKTFLFTGDIVDDKYQNEDVIEYVGSVTDPDTMNPIFIGTLQIKNITSTYDIEYMFWMGSLTDYKMWQGNADVNVQEYVLNGAVKNGKILGTSKITTPAGKTKTWDEAFKK